jgi:2-oxoglutarate dehydrogenase complex dehydrogenase (E1) component-like enzyme
MADTQNPTDALGPNVWLVDEMYEQFLDDPTSVNESWQDFFAEGLRCSV